MFIMYNRSCWESNCKLTDPINDMQLTLTASTSYSVWVSSGRSVVIFNAFIPTELWLKKYFFMLLQALQSPDFQKKCFFVLRLWFSRSCLRLPTLKSSWSCARTRYTPATQSVHFDKQHKDSEGTLLAAVTQVHAGSIQKYYSRATCYLTRVCLISRANYSRPSPARTGSSTTWSR